MKGWETMGPQISAWQSEDNEKQVVPRIISALAIGMLMVAIFWAEKRFVNWYMGEVGEAIASFFGLFR
ncbi:MAG: hypothetical protein GXP25_06805 [Planctomycetes bacterium]|nr:hypothetical protein [Planctomycetota bacterium]